jgi:hypothetical protein
VLNSAKYNVDLMIVRKGNEKGRRAIPELCAANAIAQISFVAFLTGRLERVDQLPPILESKFLLRFTASCPNTFAFIGP